MNGCLNQPTVVMRRKQRMAQERRAAQEPAAKAKKVKAQDTIMVDENHVPTAEELRRRQMRAGRFGKGAVENSVAARANVPVYAVRHLLPDQLFSDMHLHLSHHGYKAHTRFHSFACNAEVHDCIYDF